MATNERAPKRTKVVTDNIELEQPEIGDRVYARYSGNGEWYWGVATNKFYQHNDLYYSIQYDDGDFDPEHKAANGIATENQAQLNNNNNNKRTNANIEQLQPEIGDRVYARFRNEEWYWGEVMDKFHKNDDHLYYSILYDDGDYVEEHNAEDGIATEEQYHWQEGERDRRQQVENTTTTTASSPTTSRTTSSRNRVIAVTPETAQSDTPTPDQPPSSSATTAARIQARRRRRQRRVVTPENAPSSSSDISGEASNSNTGNSERPTPDPAPSSSSRVAEVRREVLTTMGNDSRIKAEGGATTLSPEERDKRKKCMDQWIQANTDPRTGKGRYVFRRGCDKGCLTKILGGTGTEPWPISVNPPDYHGAPNPFIAKQEFYVAGNETWNFFSPRFPGDTGLVNTLAFSKRDRKHSTQKEFHMFVQCATTPHKRHWHGKDAKTGRLYIGVYRKVVDEDGDDDVETIVHMDDPDLDVTCRLAIARDNLRYYRKDYGADYTTTNQSFRLAKERAKQEAGEDDWMKYSKSKQDVLAMYQVLLLEGFTMTTVPIEFVRYDEKLYQALVDVGAVIDRKGQTGQVALTPEGLHHWY
ncbi:unnamed protein product [Cylindrotheca closterium]|uniref:DUF6697 domain-containing protein n=1 Tax=Cylindrotheca closterium TaxID=2856 RepID=A0AAD2CN33_9STRA|nr:unnamed protein product [Cylindrotheca closterium]